MTLTFYLTYSITDQWLLITVGKAGCLVPLTGIYVDSVVCLDSIRTHLRFVMLRHCCRQGFNVCAAYVVLLVNDLTYQLLAEIMSRFETICFPFKVKIQRAKYCSYIPDCSQIACGV
jgi:hypothetical protein